jgi:hypothetical protein
MAFRDHAGGYGLRIRPAKAWRRGSVFSLSKRNTWYGVLSDFRSRIQYSSALFHESSGTDGTPCETDSDGNPNVFNVERNDDGSWLNNNWAKPDKKWNPNNKFVFRLRNCFFSVVLLKSAAVFLPVEIIPPTSKNFPNLLQLESDFLKLLVRQNLPFPCNRDQKLQPQKILG